jgi:hypothetical protein
VEIRIVLTAPGEADLARTVLEDLGQRLNGLPGMTWVIRIREKSPVLSRPFGNARFLLDVVLSSDDKVLIMAEAVEGWLRDQRPGVVLRATVITTSVDLSYPSNPNPPAAMILHLVQEGRENLRNKIGLANLRDRSSGRSQVHNDLVTNGGNAVQAGAIHGDVNIYTSSESPTQHDVPIILTISYKDPSSSGVAVGLERLQPKGTHDIGIVVLVEGRSTQAVVLLAIRPVVVDFSKMTQVAYSALSSRDFSIDLKPIPPQVVLEPIPPQIVAHGPDFPFTVTAGAPELFRFTLSVDRDLHVQWRLELDWSCAGRTGTVLIPESGTFRI